MDYTCDAYVSGSFDDFARDELKQNCERNNIFKAYGFNEEGLHQAIAQYCRFDRQIDFYPSQSVVSEFYYLTCVLYDNEPRKPVPVSK